MRTVALGVSSDSQSSKRVPKALIYRDRSSASRHRYSVAHAESPRQIIKDEISFMLVRISD
jgi:hypothetical protein